MPEFENLDEIPDLPSFVREQEVLLFPEFADSDFGISVPGKTNFYFTPSHHFRRGIIDKNVLQGLLSGDRLISFGAGPAYLETLLVKSFGIEVEQITLTDIDTSDFPLGVTGMQLDMHGEWPEFPDRFDIAIIPESFTSLLQFDRDIEDAQNPVSEAVVRLISRCFSLLNQTGEVRGDGHALREDELEWIGEKLAGDNIHTTHNDRSLFCRLNSATSS